MDGFYLDNAQPKNVVFESIRGEKVLMLRILVTGSLILIQFHLIALFRCMRGVSHVIFYRIDGFHFDPQNPKNLVSISIRGEKALKLHILITGSLIFLPFLPKKILDVWMVRVMVLFYLIHGSHFDPPNLKDLVFKA